MDHSCCCWLDVGSKDSSAPKRISLASPSDSHFHPSSKPSASVSPSISNKQSKAKKIKAETTIRASLSKSGANYPGPGPLIGAALALNVLIVPVTN